MQRSHLVGILAALVLAAPAVAQEPAEPAPDLLYVRYFQCSSPSDAIDELNLGRPIMMELIDEGWLLDYGILRHAWGDEWDVLDYLLLAEDDDIDTVIDEWVRRFRERQPEAYEASRFLELCPVHKDNIYSVVPAPEEES